MYVYFLIAKISHHVAIQKFSWSTLAHGGERGSTSESTVVYKGRGLGVENLVFLGVRTLWMLPLDSGTQKCVQVSRFKYN